MVEESEDLLATANLSPLKNNTNDIITAQRTCLDTENASMLCFLAENLSDVLIVVDTFLNTSQFDTAFLGF